MPFFTYDSTYCKLMTDQVKRAISILLYQNYSLHLIGSYRRSLECRLYLNLIFFCMYLTIHFRNNISYLKTKCLFRHIYQIKFRKNKNILFISTGSTSEKPRQIIQNERRNTTRILSSNSIDHIYKLLLDSLSMILCDTELISSTSTIPRQSTIHNQCDIFKRNGKS